MVGEHGVGNRDQKQDCGESADVDEPKIAVPVRQNDVGNDADHGRGEDTAPNQSELGFDLVPDFRQWPQRCDNRASEIGNYMSDIQRK